MIAVLSVALIVLAAGCQPQKIRNIDEVPGDWKRQQNAVFSIYAPPDIKGGGAWDDTYAGNYKNSRIEISFEFGSPAYVRGQEEQYRRFQKDKDVAAVKKEDIKVNGKLARLLTLKYKSDNEGLNPENVLRIIFELGNLKTGPTNFRMQAYGKDNKDLEDARKILLSIKFDKQ